MVKGNHAHVFSQFMKWWWWVLVDFFFFSVLILCVTHNRSSIKNTDCHDCMGITNHSLTLRLVLNYFSKHLLIASDITVYFSFQIATIHQPDQILLSGDSNLRVQPRSQQGSHTHQLCTGYSCCCGGNWCSAQRKRRWEEEESVKAFVI